MIICDYTARAAIKNNTLTSRLILHGYLNVMDVTCMLYVCRYKRPRLRLYRKDVDVTSLQDNTQLINTRQVLLNAKKCGVTRNITPSETNGLCKDT
jgi:hypothetical protein